MGKESEGGCNEGSGFGTFMVSRHPSAPKSEVPCETGITFGNVVTYNALLEACAKAADDQTDVYAQHALEVMKTMKENGVQPDASTYHSALKACAKSRGGLFQALEVLQAMRKAGYSASREHFNLLVDTCTKEAQNGNLAAVGQALVVLETMQKAGIVEDKGRFMTLINAIPEDNEYDKMCRRQVIKLMEQSHLSYSSIMAELEMMKPKDA
mmetsp:Transcript_37253/g.58220  ORF Transcript_37253/g.58220 Transcript_37253/m.58220 type:complete len:211 (+) Transcript_37253:572-1204(+)